MDFHIFSTMLLNVGLLLLLSTVLAELKPVRILLLQDKKSVFDQFFLVLIFSSVSILSTYTGVEVEGGIVNTRVIGVLAAGILGGPSVGILTGLISAAHRYLYSLGQFTALACCLSTMFEGICGALVYHKIQRNGQNGLLVAGITALAEIGQMLIILLVARPFADALRLVQVIALPMIVMNSLGMLLCFLTFARIFKQRDMEIGYQQSLALKIAEQCLPWLRSGLGDRVAMQQAVCIIRQQLPHCHTFIFAPEGIVAGSLPDAFPSVPAAVQRALQNQQLQLVYPEDSDAQLQPLLQKSYAIIAPLCQSADTTGALMVLAPRQRLVDDATITLVDGLSRLFSTMLELSDLAFQKQQRRKAELRALQAQINPHFLYNALNTLSSICRENPAYTRELLLVLGQYFRHTLSISQDFIDISDEVDAVERYLTIEKARFEDGLQIQWTTEGSPQPVPVPPLILQPIVENAIKHGAGTDGRRQVMISLCYLPHELCITVRDHGRGFAREDIGQSLNTELSAFSGLYNVHRRLTALYGVQGGLHIQNDNGAVVCFAIPYQREEIAR